MPNQTYIPAFQAQVGDWSYYITVMKYATVKNQVQFAHELSPNQDLNTLIQRGLSNRTEDIKKYLLQSEHRFLGALIVACWGGSPQYMELAMDDENGVLRGLDQGFGVLVLDGSQSFFALDGQHRLKAIKDAVREKPELGAEDICVLLVSHFDTDEGRERTQRLFTNINRNAKATTVSENIVLDVDDAFSIVLRRLLLDHEFLRENGRVKVFSTPPNSEGEFKLAANRINTRDAKAWSTINTFYDVLRNLAFGLDADLFDRSQRPSEELLAEAYDTLGSRVMRLLEEATNLRVRLENESAADIRSPRGAPQDGHPLMRPAVQKVLTKSLASIMDQELIDWDVAITRLAELDWKLGAEPWNAVFNVDRGAMISAKENAELLHDLLLCHLAPESRNEIKRARKAYKEIRGRTYQTTEESLASRLPN